MDLRHIDIDTISHRYNLALKRQNRDRPLLHITYPSGKKVDRPASPPTSKERWFAFAWQLECHEKNLEEVGFAAEGVPAFVCNLGPDILTGLTGSELDFSHDHTTWAIPRVKDWFSEPPLRFVHDGFLWQSMARYLRLSAEHGKGRWITASGDLHTNGDGLAALRGPQELLLDLLDCPDEIQKRLAEMHAVFEQVVQAHFDIIHPLSGRLTTSWLPAACRGRYAVIQNDFSCMVSAAMYDEFFKKYVVKESSLLDYAIYHLDGPNAIQHVESICAAPGLDAIQWVPGTGNKPCSEWPELLKKIQSLGKGIWVDCSPEQALEMAGYLRPDGCMFKTWCSSKQEAEDLVRAIEKVCAGKR